MNAGYEWPDKDRAEVVAWLTVNAGFTISYDDAEIKRVLILLGINDPKFWKATDFAGGSIAIGASEAYTYIFACWDGHAKPTDNGFAMISLDKAALIKLSGGNPMDKQLLYIMASCFLLLNFDPKTMMDKMGQFATSPSWS